LVRGGLEMADKIKERIIQEIALETVPIISKQKLDSQNIRLHLDTEPKKLNVSCNLATEYSDDTPSKIASKSITVRRDEYDSAFNQLFPDDDDITWTNPQQTFIANLLNFIKERI
jgi:hypothetical protein